MRRGNVASEIAVPWSSARSIGPGAEGVFLKSSTHPRAYGTFARVVGKYARDDKVVSLQEAVRRLTSLPASNLRLADRGALREGYFADLAIFDPAAIRDNATFAKPQQYATGMRHVFVNGVQVLRDGDHTGAIRAASCAGRVSCPPA